MNAASELVRILRNEQGRIGRSDLLTALDTTESAAQKPAQKK
jgi:hypothetical protein